MTAGTASHTPHAALQDLLRRAMDVASFPIGWISFLELGRERIAARSGIAFGELGAERSFALKALSLRDACYVEDAAAGPWSEHPLVSGAPRARFVGIVPLVTRAGAVLGALTLLDTKPRTLRRHDRVALANLADIAAARLETMGSLPPESAGAEEPPATNLEERLEQERALSEAVLENLTGAFVLVGPGGKLVRWNKQLSAAVGYPDSRLAAMSPLDFISPKDRGDAEVAMRSVLEDGREVSVEVEFVDSEGNVRPYALTGRPVTLGKRRLMLGMARDITLRKRAEQQMARAKERLDLALASSSLALWDWDLASDKVYFNESWSMLVGEAPRESMFRGEEVVL